MTDPRPYGGKSPDGVPLHGGNAYFAGHPRGNNPYKRPDPLWKTWRDEWDYSFRANGFKRLTKKKEKR